MPDEPGPAQVIRPVGIPSVELVAKPTINLGALVARVAPVEVVTVVESFTVRVLDDGAGPTTLTAADVQTIVAAVVRAQGRRDWRTDVALVVAILSLIVAWLAYQQDRAEYARPDPPAIVQQQSDPAEIDRRVDERRARSSSSARPSTTANPTPRRTCASDTGLRPRPFPGIRQGPDTPRRAAGGSDRCPSSATGSPARVLPRHAQDAVDDLRALLAGSIVRPSRGDPPPGWRIVVEAQGVANASCGRRASGPCNAGSHEPVVRVVGLDRRHNPKISIRSVTSVR